MEKESEVMKIYDEIAEKYYDVYDEGISDHPYIDIFLESIPKGGKIIDLGCGTGRITAYVKNKGYDIVGVDFSKNMIALARKTHPQVEFIEEDMRLMKFENESFDGIMMPYSIFHMKIEEAKTLLRKSYNALKSPGYFFIVVQEGEGEMYTSQPSVKSGEMYLKLYTESELKEILENVGFKILKTARKSYVKGRDLPYKKLIIIGKK